MTVVATWLAVTALLIASLRGYYGQEKPVRETRMWKIADNVNGARVAVIDTEGVCLYVVTGEVYAQGTVPAVAAVPKTQLPKGTGCQ
jgi:hypothetical protein